MRRRESLLDNFENITGDLEYHPKRGAVYLAIGLMALLLKGIFLMRKASDGFGLPLASLSLVQPETSQPAIRPEPKKLPRASVLTGEIIQDFGTGTLLFVSLLDVVKVAVPYTDLLTFDVFISGIVTFVIGWVIRRLTIRAAMR